MAMVADGGWGWSIVIEDNQRKRSTTSGYFAPGVDSQAEAIAALNQIRDELINVTEGRIVGATVSMSFVEDAPGDLRPLAGSEAERKLVINARGGSKAVTATWTVASPFPSLEARNTDRIDWTQVAQIDALCAALLANAFTSRGEALTEIADVYVRHSPRKIK